MKTMLIKLGALILKALPIEQILATAINKAIDNIGDGNMDKALKTIEHIQEICDLTADILADKKVDLTESAQIVGKLKDLRLVLLDRWATGQPCKDVQGQIATLSVDALPSYA